MRFILAVVGLAISLAAPAYAIDVQPGLWQGAETADINGKVYPPEVTTECIKPEDAKDIVKAAQVQMQEAMKDQPEECSKVDIKQNGNVILFEMKCGDPKQREIDVSMTMTMTVNSPQNMSSMRKATMSVGGRTIVTSATTESKWISASCDRK